MFFKSTFLLILTSLSTISAITLPFTDPIPGVKKTDYLAYTVQSEGITGCGLAVSSYDAPLIVVSTEYWDKIGKSSGISNPNKHPLCGLKVQVTTPFGTQMGVVAESCKVCLGTTEERRIMMSYTSKKQAEPLFGPNAGSDVVRPELIGDVSWDFVADSLHSKILDLWNEFHKPTST